MARYSADAKEQVRDAVDTAYQLSDQVQRFPHVLAAAMEDIGARIDTGRWKVERTLAEAVDGLLQISAAVHPAEDRSLAPRPFELEPIEQQFGPAND